MAVGTEGTRNADGGKKSQDVVDDSGITVMSTATYSAADKLVLKIPAKRLSVQAYLGKATGGTTTSGTAYTTIPVTSDVVKLDTELTSSDKSSNDLVVVGGPCVNKIAADLLGKTFPACGTDSGINTGTALIQLFSDRFASGKTALLVAGWEASDTDLAARLVQTGTGLSGRTESKVWVTGSVSSPTVTAA